MDWLQFSTSITKSLAWPITTIVLVSLLRRPLKDLVSMLQKMKYKDFEMEFGRKLAEARQEIELSTSQIEDTVVSPQEERVIDLARVSPRAAVTEAWRWVELASLDAARNLFGDEFRNKTMTFRAIRMLETDERIDRSAVSLMRDLRGLRNDAVHSPEFALSVDTALEYAEMARHLVGYLKTIDTSNNKFNREKNTGSS